MAGKDNPLLKALPPETDYISYLTILEYNLTHQQLPTLHGILQDATLTANIGWDLVHLLIPLLPQSQQCLQDISRLGNPREVVLKVTELLEGLRDEDEEEVEVDSEGEGQEKTVAKRLQDIKREDIEVHDHSNDTTATPGGRAKVITQPSKGLKFTALLEMLSILHPRIRTKYPSRFLSTSLQAVLPAYMQVAEKVEATEAVLGLIKDLSLRTNRPKLPPRKSSSAVHMHSAPLSAPDPEGQNEALGADEAGLQSRLLQSFLTYVTEGYMTSLVADEDVPGMAWCSRYQEKLHPAKTIPGRRNYSSLFAEEGSLHERDAVMGHILALARDLKIESEQLLSVITKPEEVDAEEEEEALPSIASDVPLSRKGSLCLLATIAASSAFFDAPSLLSPLQMIPEYAAILDGTVDDATTGSTGAEAESILDAVLFLGFFILNNEPKLTSEDDEGYNNMLKQLSLLSASIPSPVLRYHAHLLTCSLLHLHPEGHFRLAFIRDTLEHCPFDNLKGSAVGWLKDELLSADRREHKERLDEKPSIFATPAALETLQPFLFTNVDTLLEGQSPIDSYTIFQAHLSFYLAVLNLLYLLLSSPSLSLRLELADAVKKDRKRFSDFLDPLAGASRRFRTGILSDDISLDDEESKEAALAGLELVDMSVQQVEDVMVKIRES